MLRYVIYARYSSDLQSPDTIDDQFRKCRERAALDGWVEVRTYQDDGVSGVGNDRQGFQRLMADAVCKNRDFDILMIDDTSRLSRSLGDVVNVHDRLKHFGVRVIAVSQGIDTENEQSELLIAMHGITDSLYVKELGKKTHRGLEGKVIKGLSAGGRCYGYDNVPAEGGGVRWIINETEAIVVREIYEWSASGYSLKRIAGLLNARKTPPPQKRIDRPHATWCPSAIRAMLLRQLYVGRRIWNQTKFVKTLGTNKRVARPRPQSEWQVQDVPELRIISDDLWCRVQKRQASLKERYAESGKKPVNRGASSAYLLSGFLVCGNCGARLIIVSGGGAGARYGCPQHWNRQACTNKITVCHTAVEGDLFRELQDAVLAPGVVDYLTAKLLKAQEKQATASDHERRGRELESEIGHIVAAIVKMGDSKALLDSLKCLESEQRELAAVKKTSKRLTGEEIRGLVSGAITDIPKLLAKSPQLAKAKLSQHVSSVRMLPQPDGTYIAEGEWDLLGNRGPVMVAGAGFEPATFGL